MEHRPVRSSTVASVGYDEQSRTLEVAFRNGSLYMYSNVPAHIADGLRSAASVGQYLDKNVKKAGYPFRRLK